MPQLRMAQQHYFLISIEIVLDLSFSFQFPLLFRYVMLLLLHSSSFPTTPKGQLLIRFVGSLVRTVVQRGHFLVLLAVSSGLQLSLHYLCGVLLIASFMPFSGCGCPLPAAESLDAVSQAILVQISDAGALPNSALLSKQA